MSPWRNHVNGGGKSLYFCKSEYTIPFSRLGDQCAKTSRARDGDAHFCAPVSRISARCQILRSCPSQPGSALPSPRRSRRWANTWSLLAWQGIHSSLPCHVARIQLFEFTGEGSQPAHLSSPTSCLFQCRFTLYHGEFIE